MTPPLANTFSKEERLCGKTCIAALFRQGRWGVSGNIKYCAAPREDGCSRIMVSVPKKFFKRAVRRNLLKRRIREAYRTRKHLLRGKSYDIMFQFNSAVADDFPAVCDSVASILNRLADETR